MNKTPSMSTSLVCFFVVIIFYSFHPAHSHNHIDFLQCLNTSAVSGYLYTPNNSSYASILNSSIQNLRFESPSTPKPLIIITPMQESQIQVVVLCSKEYGVQIRTRSGGHDYEGLSYTSALPFVVIDLINLSDITVDLKRNTAWVGAGATIGQLYYEISLKSETLAFPAGTCPSVGVGGHFSGGGFGPLSRKHGLAADNVIDARLIDINGKILDRKSMVEELFWAIRGGGGASFGVITAWKVKLVDVPEVVTVCSVSRSLEQNGTALFHKWQSVAPNLPKDVGSTVTIRRVSSSKPSDKSILAAVFNSLFLGEVDKFLTLVQQRFPVLGVKKEDCTEVSWIQSVLFFAGYPTNASSQILASRTPFLLSYFKGNSDYVQDPISEFGLKDLWKLLYEKEGSTAIMLFYAYGGRMNEIPESSLPFPHRSGNLYQFEYDITWDEAGLETSERYISWIRRVYKYMTPYVSMFPRAAYINNRNLDLGVNNEGNTSYAQASIWGDKYFKSNFKMLAGVKTKVDPGNFFRNEQSIPLLYS